MNDPDKPYIVGSMARDTYTGEPDTLFVHIIKKDGSGKVFVAAELYETSNVTEEAIKLIQRAITTYQLGILGIQ